MRLFKFRLYNYEVDLDNPETYDYLPQTTEELRNLMFREIGYYYCYVNFWHNDGMFDGQKKDVEKLIKHFTKNECENSKNVLWYQEQVFLFQNETENMC